MSWKTGALVAVALVAVMTGARLAQDAERGTASWDATRAAGFAGYLLLWASVESGIAVHMRWRVGGEGLSWMLEAHRITSVLAVSFTIGHVWGLVIDPVVRFTPWEVAVPLLGSYRPLQVGLGALSLYLLAALLITTALSGRLPYSAWRCTHHFAVPAYVLALLHGITAGTDSGSVVVVALYAASASAVAATAVWRTAGRGWTLAADAPGPRRP